MSLITVSMSRQVVPLQQARKRRIIASCLAVTQSSLANSRYSGTLCSASSVTGTLKLNHRCGKGAQHHLDAELRAARSCFRAVPRGGLHHRSSRHNTFHFFQELTLARRLIQDQRPLPHSLAEQQVNAQARWAKRLPQRGDQTVATICIYACHNRVLPCII